MPLVELQLAHLMRPRCHSVAHSEQTRKRTPAPDPAACTMLETGGEPQTGQAAPPSGRLTPSAAKRLARCVHQTCSAAKARQAWAGPPSALSKGTALSAHDSRGLA